MQQVKKKDRSFVTKVMKATMEFGKRCPTCGEVMKPVRLITSQKNDRTQAWRFRASTVMTCKCNSREVFGA
ncbi:MAG: hypothetical protein ONB23_08785 [candidate division KSB1 bacterium]|nr:hypothetical protein [candidate division KSB1 bacterium]